VVLFAAHANATFASQFMYAASPDGHGGGRGSGINVITGAVSTTIPVGVNPRTLAVPPDGGRVGVDGRVAVVGTAAKQVITTIAFGTRVALASAAQAVALPTASGKTSPTPPPCTGDCDSIGQVIINNVLTMVSIALGNATVANCLPGDANHDGRITVDEILTAVTNALNGCGVPLPTRTPTPSPTPTRQGPIVTYLGVLKHITGCVCCTVPCDPEPTPYLENGRQVFEVPGGQLLLVVEGRTVDGLPPAVGSFTQPNPNLGDGRPDIQIESTQGLGQGSAAVCDDGFHAPVTDGGGVYPVPTPDFSFTTTITDALNDFGCRFEFHLNGDQCTTYGDAVSPFFLGAGSQAQFCNKATGTAAFNPGDSLVTVRLRDKVGNIGPTAQIVVRVATPTP